MKRRTKYWKNYAVSEIIGGLILVLVAVISFSTIYFYVFPPDPEYDASVKIEGSVNYAGIVSLKHIGGNPLNYYKVMIYYSNGTFIGSKIEKGWSFGEYRYPLQNITDVRLVNENIKLVIKIYSLNKDGTEQEIFTWQASGSISRSSSNSPILISSLRTNTPDEDLICYSYPLVPEINATSYIYNWIKNGASIADLILPFDTEDNETCKDYSGNDIEVEVRNAKWTSHGVVGGSYHFDGSSEYITMDLPNVFNDIGNNDITISLWLKSDDINEDNAVALMASKDNDNFFKIFLQGGEVHFGICVNGVKDAVRTESLSSDEWYHIVGVWDASNNLILIYWNGEGGLERTIPGYRNFAMGSGVNLLELGHGTASSKFWEGYIDQFIVYKHALSKDQIYQNYLSEKAGDYDRRIIVSEETSLGDSWQCIVTPNDSINDDAPVSSNILNITNYQGGD